MPSEAGKNRAEPTLGLISPIQNVKKVYIVKYNEN